MFLLISLIFSSSNILKESTYFIEEEVEESTTTQQLKNSKEIIKNFNIPTYIIPNVGQYPSEIKYVTDVGGVYAIFYEKKIIFDNSIILKVEGSIEPFNLIKGDVGFRHFKGHNKFNSILYKGIRYISNDLITEITIDDNNLKISYIFDGCKEKIKIDYSPLPLITKEGEIQINHLKETKPLTFSNGRIIDSKYIKTKEGIFIKGNFTCGMKTIIDPTIYSTFIGNNTVKQTLYDSVVDDENNFLFLTGKARDVNFPSTYCPLEDEFKCQILGSAVFVICLNDEGELEWAFHINSGDTDVLNSEFGVSIGYEINSQYKYLYVLAEAKSYDFPTTTGSCGKESNTEKIVLIQLHKNGDEYFESNCYTSNEGIHPVAIPDYIFYDPPSEPIAFGIPIIATFDHDQKSSTDSSNLCYNIVGKNMSVIFDVNRLDLERTPDEVCIENTTLTDISTYSFQTSKNNFHVTGFVTNELNSWGTLCTTSNSYDGSYFNCIVANFQGMEQTISSINCFSVQFIGSNDDLFCQSIETYDENTFVGGYTKATQLPLATADCNAGNLCYPRDNTSFYTGFLMYIFTYNSGMLLIESSARNNFFYVNNTELDWSIKSIRMDGFNNLLISGDGYFNTNNSNNFLKIDNIDKELYYLGYLYYNISNIELETKINTGEVRSITGFSNRTSISSIRVSGNVKYSSTFKTKNAWQEESGNPASFVHLISCEPGKIGSLDTGCTSCIAGQYDNGESCVNCNGGYFSDSEGLTICEKCESGKYSIIGQSECIFCPSDGQIPNPVPPSQSNCIWCEDGEFAVQGDSTCGKCQPGYKSVPNKDTCIECIAGTYNVDEGMSKCSDCEIGTFNSQNGSTNYCSDCRKGTYSYERGKSFCYDCPKGTFGTKTGSSSIDDCEQCPAGTYSNVLGLSSKCFDCPSGTYSLPGSINFTDCLSCSDGTVSGSGYSECIYCFPGEEPDPTQSYCEPCKSGFYSKNGTKCEGCLEGTHSSIIGASICNDCSEKTLCIGNGNCEKNRNSSSSINCIQCNDDSFLLDSYCIKCPSYRFGFSLITIVIIIVIYFLLKKKKSPIGFYRLIFCCLQIYGSLLFISLDYPIQIRGSISSMIRIFIFDFYSISTCGINFFFMWNTFFITPIIITFIFIILSLFKSNIEPLYSQILYYLQLPSIMWMAAPFHTFSNHLVINTDVNINSEEFKAYKLVFFLGIFIYFIGIPLYYYSLIYRKINLKWFPSKKYWIIYEIIIKSLIPLIPLGFGPRSSSLAGVLSGFLILWIIFIIYYKPIVLINLSFVGGLLMALGITTLGSGIGWMPFVTLYPFSILFIWKGSIDGWKGLESQMDKLRNLKSRLEKLKAE